MSKSVGFRNSGKLDLGGKGTEYAVAGALLVVIVAVLVFVGTQIWSCGGGGPIGRDEPHVKCVKCSEEWAIEPENVRTFNREMEMEMGDAPVGADHEKCGGRGTVFMMNRCPKCEKYYLSKRVTDPEAFTQSGGSEVCPYCGTDLFKWSRDQRRGR